MSSVCGISGDMEIIFNKIVKKIQIVQRKVIRNYMHTAEKRSIQYR